MPSVASTVEIKGPQELRIMREAGSVLADALRAVALACVPGVTTADLDSIAGAEIRRRGAKPAFLNYHGFPAVLCASVNSEVVHGIPREDRVLHDGDVVSLDLGCVVRGYYADSAVTVPVGARVSSEATALIEATREALSKGIEQMWPGKRVGDISHAIQGAVEPLGYSIVRAFVGHGIGRALHEAPAVPNYGRPGTGTRLVPGMVLAVEPMVNLGGPEVRVLDDGWTAVAVDGRLSAHFEHSVAVTEEGPEILTVPA